MEYENKSSAKNFLMTYFILVGVISSPIFIDYVKFWYDTSKQQEHHCLVDLKNLESLLK